MDHRAGRALSPLWPELGVQALKHRVGTVVRTQAQHPLPAMPDHASGLEHQFLQHRLHAPALGRVSQRRVCANECVLPHQAQDAPRRVGLGAHALDLQHLAPQAHALALAQVAPGDAGIGHARGGNGLYWRFAWVPLDDAGHFARQRSGLSADFFNDGLAAQARVSAKQQRPRCQLRGHGQDALQVVFGLARRVLHTRAQSQLQAVAQRAQVGRAACEAVHALVSAPDAFLLGVGVVHHKGVPVQRHVAAGQDPEVHWPARIAGRQQREVERIDQFEPGGRMGVHALAQGRARWHRGNPQCAAKELVATKGLDGFKIILALHQQAQVAFEDVAVGDGIASHRQLLVHACADVQALEVLPHQGKSGVGGEVVGQLFDDEVGHVGGSP